jgi:hypothetical protein
MILTQVYKIIRIIKSRKLHYVNNQAIHTPAAAASSSATWAPENMLSPGAKGRFLPLPDAVDLAFKNIPPKHAFIFGSEFRFGSGKTCIQKAT